MKDCLVNKEENSQKTVVKKEIINLNNISILLRYNFSSN